MTEARIRTGFGNIRITFNTNDELKEILDSLESQIQMLQTTASKISPPPPRLPKPGYEYAYRFLASGRVELLFFPESKNQIVALALFAYAPESVPIMEIEQITLIEKVFESVLSQSNNKKYYVKTDLGYRLSPEGFNLVLTSVPAHSQSIEETEP